MSRRKYFLGISITAVIVLGLGITFWVGRKPRKPAVISPGDYAYTIEFAQYRLPQVMKQKHLPGFAVVLVDDQDILWQDTFGFANLEEDQPAETDTVFKLWSVAKAFTALETMRLVQDGLVDLDTPINAYIPDFSIQSRFPDSEPITVRSILAHRAGLPRHGCQQVDLNIEVLSNLVASLADCYVVGPVGYRYHYSNIGFDLLGYLVEEMRGQPFPVYMRDALLRPNQMDNSAFLRSYISPQRDIAQGYEFYKGNYYPYHQGDIPSVPSGNLFASIEDMGRFVQFIFREGQAKGEQLVDPDTLQAMFVEQTWESNDPHTMGLGWKVNRVLGSELLVWHDGGATEGTGALVAFLPERKLGLALIANGTTFDGSVSVPLAIELLGLMLETQSGAAAPLPETQEPIEIPSADLEKYVGRYIAFGEVLEISLKGERLKGRIQGFSFNLEALSETTFQPRNWLADTGLVSLIGAPVDLRQLKIEFMPGDAINSQYLLIHLSGIGYEICPAYPDYDEIPPHWRALLGHYVIKARLPSGRIGTEVLGEAVIEAQDGVLRMAGVVGPLLPTSETEILILSGPFAGETMLYEPNTGRLYRQNYVHIKE